jgi:hypothetical protein
MIQVLKETTVWADNTPNHTYLVNAKDKLIAFISSSTGVKKTFSKPMSFDRRYRKFQLVETLAGELPADAREVMGSKGQVYIVAGGSCTCPGFKFRGKCKHI